MNRDDIHVYEQNHSSREYTERHMGCDSSSMPKQTPIECSDWDELVGYFRGYFNHFGDDTSSIDDATFKRIVKTIWRFSNVVAFMDGMKFQKELTPNFKEMLVNWREAVYEHNRNCDEENDIPLNFNELISRI